MKEVGSSGLFLNEELCDLYRLHIAVSEIKVGMMGRTCSSYGR
jgi:hypothetical protein